MDIPVGGVFKHVFIFNSDPSRSDSQYDVRIFLKWVGSTTTNYGQTSSFLSNKVSQHKGQPLYSLFFESVSNTSTFEVLEFCWSSCHRS